MRVCKNTKCALVCNKLSARVHRLMLRYKCQRILLKNILISYLYGENLLMGDRINKIRGHAIG